MMWDVPAEEEAFLRSLGWTSVELDDEEEWGLTEEEIAAFQASAAARAAAQQSQQQQQYEVYGGSCQSQQQQQVQANAQQGISFAAKALQGPSSELWGVGGACGASYVLKGHAAAAATGMLLGVHLAPELLGYDSCGDSSSSSDDEDAGGSASRHGIMY
jgi:hypothetical protein